MSVLESPMFGLYIHWPFCARRCPYCDYNAHVRDTADIDGHGRALVRELRHWGERTAGRQLTSIFFGGGTPSLMPPKLVQELIVVAEDYWSFAGDMEITLEANPTSSEADKFRALNDAGVNRLSLGVQALNDADLKFLGRSHSTAEAKAAIQLAADIFPRYSFDLIYARPNQTLESWAVELELAATLWRDHVSLYQLTVEPNTAFATAYARGDFTLPDADAAAALYDYTLAFLAEHSLDAYEVSSFAKPGGECRHNLCYWQYYDYVGIGCGAHSRLTFGHSAPRGAAPAVAGESVADSSAVTTAAAERSAEQLFKNAATTAAGTRVPEEFYKNSAATAAAATHVAEAQRRLSDHKFLKTATANYKLPETWQQAVEKNGYGQEHSEILTPRGMALEMLLMNLRTTRGLELRRLHQECGLEFEQVIDKNFFRQAINGGLLEYNRQFLRATPAGRAVLDDVILRLMPGD
jgi:putative oxygen-independent coproporphyrinogen III oxidase